MIFFLHPRPLNQTELFAPLYFNAGDAYPDLSLNWTVHNLIERGVPSEKIVLSVFTFGFFLQTLSEENGLNVPATRAFVRPRPFTNICTEVKRLDLTVVHDRRVATYAYLGQLFVSYYDAGDAYSLGQYVVQNNLGGGLISPYEFDDVDNECGCGHMPIFNGFVQGLRNGTVENCTK